MSKREKSNDMGWPQGYMEAKKSKLVKQFNDEKIRNKQSESKEPQVFKGISIYVNGYTTPSADELKKLMIKYGGRYDQYYKLNDTTHIIANNLPNAKVKQLKKNEKVVKPQWITDSIAAGRLLPCDSYQLYRTTGTISFNQTEEVKANFINDAAARTSDEHLVASEAKTLRAGEDNFLKEFYSHSRLHHISTAGAKFKEYVGQLRNNHNGSFPGRERLREWKQSKKDEEEKVTFELQKKVVMHLDMDCFFVSAGLRKHPHLKGLPVAVTHSRGGEAAKSTTRPVGSDMQYEMKHYGRKMVDKDGSSDFGSLSAISSCNYEARKMGVRNGMMLGEALKMCPELKTIPYDFEAYEEISKTLYDTVTSYTLEVEAVSCDELFIDCTNVLRETKTTPLEFASFLREEIHNKTSCTASAGMAENVLLARLATKKIKPNCQMYLDPSKVDEFIKPHLVRALPGVGSSLRHRLESLGILTCSDLQKCRLEMLQKEFGPKTGLTLYQHCRGNDDSVIQSNRERKSVSAEVNYGIRFQTQEEATKFLTELSEEVSQRMKNVQKKGRNISLKLKVRKEDAPVETAKFMGHGVCDNVTRSTSLGVPTDSSSVIAAECIALLKNSGIAFQDLRGVGIQVGRLDSLEKHCGNITNYLQGPGRCKVKRNDAENVKTASYGNLPEVNQLDAGVLSELPEDIRQEILQAYKIRVPLIEQTKGRPVAADKQELELPESSKVSDVQEIHSSELDASVLNALPPDIRQEVLQAYKISPTELQTHKITVNSKTLSTSQKIKGTTLGGAENLDEVKELLSEWIDSTNEPANEDIDVFTRYLQDLLLENLELTDLVLKHFYRKIGKKSVEAWKAVYSTVVRSVQVKMRESYGSDLKVSEF